MKSETAIAKAIYDEFKDKAGSEYVATAFAINGLIHLILKYKPRRVLEVGAGIGTTTKTLITALRAVHGDDYKLVSIESNEYCISQLKANVLIDGGSAIVARNYEDIPPDIPPFDFVLIDGGGPYWQDSPEDGAPIVEQNTLYFSQLMPDALVFFENDRAAQRALFLHITDHPVVYWNSFPFRGGTGFHAYKLHPSLWEILTYRVRHHWNKIKAKGFRRLRQIKRDWVARRNARR